jgi:hypothetical protein
MMLIPLSLPAAVRSGPQRVTQQETGGPIVAPVCALGPAGNTGKLLPVDHDRQVSRDDRMDYRILARALDGECELTCNL